MTPRPELRHNCPSLTGDLAPGHIARSHATMARWELREIAAVRGGLPQKITTLAAQNR
ncbi:hypothetical protein PanWU01x14_132710, partial [Parasponia andersonii]